MLKLEIKTDGAAFCEYDSDELSTEGRYELARLLRKVAVQIETGSTDGKIMDVNGNCCGKWNLN